MKSSVTSGAYGVVLACTFVVALLVKLTGSWFVVAACGIGAVVFLSVSWIKFRKGD